MENETVTQHKVFLAVPGKNVCWGTVVGVVNSTSAHIAYPHNGGWGFSGVEDFNVLWAEAHNAFIKGEITHFAMLHGDITPDPQQRWLDILLEEMDARQTPLVSVVSPIKDNRGITSTGIADLDDPWRPWRRFTMRDIFELPETFDNVAAGYPDRPLLHNTGLWVCDLRHPVFQQDNENGELDLQFAFPTRAKKQADGTYIHQRESEDWLFSRDLWARGVRNTWMTRRVRLIHHGKMDFATFGPWGTFLNGDEDTADKWRAELDALPLRTLQILEFELGAGCNMADEHKECPNRNPLRYASLDTSATLDDETIIDTAVKAYTELGFDGLIGWIYYNEPLLEMDRMFRLMGTIKAQAPKARFILWTNGTLIPEDCKQFEQFEQIVISGYNDDSARGRDRLTAEKIDCRWIDNPQMDDRLYQIEPVDKTAPCLRPFVELIIDAHGNTHLCCYDWQGKATLGNVFTQKFSALADKWRAQLPGIGGHKMNGEAPPFCHACGHRWDKYQSHDDKIVDRARRLRAKMEGATP